MVTPDTNEDVQRLVDSGVVVVMRGADADTIIDVASALAHASPGGEATAA